MNDRADIARREPLQTVLRRALSALYTAGDLIEMRILDLPRHGTASGYFDDLDKLAACAAQFDGRGNIYTTINPVRPDLLARACNRVVERPKAATTDSDILCRKVLLVDLDPVRPSGVSATDDEHEHAVQRGRDVLSWLRLRGWADPCVIDSGNGIHLRYRIDLPNDVAVDSLVKNVLESISLRWSDALVTVDRTVHNAARIARLPGTLTMKGDHLTERPHRRARMRRVAEVHHDQP